MSSVQPVILHKMLTDNLRSAFLKEFARRLPIMHQEAVSRSKDEAVIEAFKQYYFGQTRYFLTQSLFVGVANETGLETGIFRCEQNGFPIAIVKSGKFYLTLHFDSSPAEMIIPNSSLVRKQSSMINHELIQPKLFGATFNEQKLLDATQIYANIVFGRCPNGDEFSNDIPIRIAVPYLRKTAGREKLCYAGNYEYYEILSTVIQRETQGQAQTPMVNIATPKIKVLKSG